MENKNKTSEAQKRAMLKYQRKFIHVSINMTKELRQKVSEYCDMHGISLNQIVVTYLEKLIEEDMIKGTSKTESK